MQDLVKMGFRKFFIISILSLPVYGNNICTPQLGCPAEILVHWWHHPPYIYNATEESERSDALPQKIKGHMKEIVEMLVRDCCGDCTTLKYAAPTQTSSELEKRIGTTNAHLIFPVHGVTSRIVFQNYPFFPLIEPPGSILFQEPKDDHYVSEVLMKAVFSGWPVFVLTLVMAWISGIIIWALDCFCNSDFPQSFFRGTFEGFWWAYVSMTTVGYGDKVPRSFIAKFFAFVWVIIGLVIIGIFTATISTELTSLCLQNDVTLAGKTISAFRNSPESRYGSNNNAKVIEGDDIMEIVDSIHTKGSDGVLIDSYVAAHHKDKILDRLEFTEVFEDNLYSFGFVVTNSMNNLVIPKCLRHKLSSNESNIDDIVLKINTLKEPPPNPALEKSLRLFDGNSKVFHNAVFVCLGASALFLILGVAWEYMYYRPRNDKQISIKEAKRMNSKRSYRNVLAVHCQDIEELMLSQVEIFYMKFHDKMQEVSRKYPGTMVQYTRK